MKRALSVILAMVMMCSLLLVSAVGAEPSSAEEFRQGKTVQIAKYGHYVLFTLQEDGTLWISGDSGWNNAYSVTGNNRGYDKTEGNVYYRSYPEKVLSGVSSIEVCGLESILVRKNDGSIWSTGVVPNTRGELVNGKAVYQENSNYVKYWDDILQIDECGHYLMVKNDHSLWGMGANEYSQLGQGAAPRDWEEFVAWQDAGKNVVSAPIKIMEDVQKAAAGWGCSFALKPDGTLWSWGKNFNGQLGNGTPPEEQGYDQITNTEFPKQMMENVVDFNIAPSGYGFGVALKNDGSLWGWGASGGIGNQSLTSPIKVADGVRELINEPGFDSAFHTYYKKLDGTIWVYSGGKTGRQIQLPSSLTDISQLIDIQGGYVILKTDGSLWAYGNNPTHLLGIETPDKYLDASKLVKDLENIDKPIQLSGYGRTTPATSIFTDVAATSPYSAAVAWAVKENITAGTTPTTFAPGATCTNGQILTFLWRAKGQPAPTIANPFTDVQESNYYYKAALWAYENGMVTGTVFNSAAPCTRSQTVNHLWTLAGKPAPAKSAAFNDVDGDADYAKAVAWAVEQGITTGTSATAFAPNATCTRGQIVTFLYRDLAK